MPMLDAYIPEGALTADAEKRLLATLTDILIEHEGADPANPRARSLAWVFLHRPTEVWVAGERSIAPHYRFVASVPEGQFNKERRKAVTAAVTNAVLDAEGGNHPRQPERVWVMTPEVQDGTWGHAGRIYGLAQIVGFVLNDKEKGAAYAKQTLSARRESRNSEAFA